MPIGRRVVTGFVVDVEPRDQQGIKDVLEVLDDQPSIPPTIMDLARRVADYYLCSWGEVLQAALPSGLQPSSSLRVELTVPLHADELEAMRKRAPLRARLLEFLSKHRSEVSVAYLQKQLGTSTIADQLDALHRAGMITITRTTDEELTSRRIRAVSLARKVADAPETIQSVFDELDKRAPKQSLALGQIYLAHMRGEGPLAVTKLANELGISPAVIEGLVQKELATTTYISGQAPYHSTTPLATVDEANLVLNADQQRAVSAITEALEGGFTPFLLEGVTGSGKTVVYQRVMRAALNAGKSCLMLVPEIALTPQLHDRFRAVFGDRVLLLHSRISQGARADLWQQILKGSQLVVLGARSAVFAPLAQLGVIVVDEEHEPSYKQDDPAPRYHARDVAVMRASLERCAVIMGSATPSLESVHNVRSNRYKHLLLPRRTDGAVMPRISLVHIAQERTAGRMIGTLSHTLVESVQARLTRNEGSILFLNRRGYASQLECQDCGYVAPCPNCDVHLTWHKVPGVLRCHYCGYSETVRTACHQCGGVDLKESGIGTQRVEQDLAKAIGSMTLSGNRTPTIARMDADTMQRRGAHRLLLEQFAAGSIDVIVGTQMVAKGLDLPRVTLVGVVMADHSLHQSDFRAAERTLQLLVQVSGRAGRQVDHPGEVVIQTYSPQHPVIRAVTENKVAEWTHLELASRKEAMYPPYARFITIELSSLSETDVDHVSRVFHRLLPTDHPALLRFPPVVPSIARIRNRHRRVIVIKNPKNVDPSGSTMRAVLGTALEQYASNHAVASVRVTVDVDASGTL